MATEIERLAVLIEANTKSYERAMRRIERKTDAAMRGASKRVGRLDTALTTASATATRFAKGFLAAFGGAAVARSVGRVASELSQIIDVADKVGVTTDQLQELRFAADQNGVAISGLDTAIQRFSRRIGEAANGSGELSAILKANNFQFRDADGNLRPLIDLLKDYADLVKNADSKQAQLLLSFKAFDTEGAGLVNALRDGAEGIDALRRKAQDLDIVIRRDLLQRGKDLEDQIKQTGDVMGTAFDEFVVTSAPLVTKGLQLITSEMQRWRRQNEEIEKELNAIGEFFAKVFSADLQQRIEGLRGEIEQLVGALNDPLPSTPVDDLNKQLDAAQEKLRQLILLQSQALRNTSDARLVDLASRQSGRNPSAATGAGGLVTPPVTPRDKPGRSTVIPGAKSEADKAAEQTQRIIDGLRFEAEQVSRTAEQQRLHNELRSAGVTLASEQGQVISDLVGRIQAEEARLEALEERQEAVAEAAQFMGDELKSALSDVISDADNAGDAILRLTQRIAEAALEASVFGSGPLAALAGGGTSGAGGVGSANILSSLFGGFFGDGGTAPANKISMFGEKGPELGIPKVPTNIIPIRNLGGGGHVTQVIDQRVNAPPMRRTEERMPDGRTMTRLVVADPQFERGVRDVVKKGGLEPKFS